MRIVVMIPLFVMSLFFVVVDVIMMPVVCILLYRLHLLVICFLFSLFFSRVGPPSGYEAETTVFVCKHP